MKKFNEYKEIIEENLLTYLPKVSDEAITIYKAMSYSLEAGGKRIRPVLLLAACDFAGGDIKKALPYALALEFIHTYSLIHDDLPAMDDDELRRGKPTNHMVFGAGMATLAGDGLLNSAFDIMMEDIRKNAESQNLLGLIKACEFISKSAGTRGMIAGQVADIEAESRTCTKAELDFIHKNKTAALLTAPVIAGLYIGNADEDLISDFKIYAENLGLAFQISDDILDVVGDVKEIGKNPGQDIAHGKATYISLYGLEESRKILAAVDKAAKDSISKYGDKANFFIELVDKLERRSK